MWRMVRFTRRSACPAHRLFTLGLALALLLPGAGLPRAAIAEPLAAEPLAAGRLAPAFSAAGTVTNGQMGGAVAAAGDVNGDGFADVVAAAPRTSTVYVFHGSARGLGGSVAQPAFKVLGEGQSDLFGHTVAGLGDVNGDGYADIAVGAYERSKVYVFHGSAQGLAGTAAQPAFSAAGAQGSHFGAALAGADVNGDGFDDLVVGAWGQDKVYVFHGSAQGLKGTPAQPAFSVLGEGQGDRFGYAVAGLGDVNGDKFEDVAIGAPYADAIYAFYGSAQGLYGVAAQPNFRRLGEKQGDRFGGAVAGAGDVNGDGYGELLVGAYAGDTAYVFAGSVQGLTGTAAQPAFRVRGEGQGQMFGYALAGAGDVNNDGFGDILVGAYAADKAYGFLGSASGLAGSASQPGFSMLGESQGDHFGGAVAGAGDTNGDRLADLLVGAGLFGSNEQGKVYAYSGFNDRHLHLPQIVR